MTLTFFCNFLNQHQVYVADELFTLLGDEFHFVATLSTRVEDLKGGNDYRDRPYCISATASEDARQYAIYLAHQSDVCVFGACSQEYAVERAKKNPIGLSFEMGERWLKRGWINVLSPHLLKWYANYLRYYKKCNFYKLCLSAYAARDDEKLFAYKGRHYKWGYFVDVKNSKQEHHGGKQSIVNIMWCARFIRWKHPELIIMLACKLKENGLRFSLDMYGTGPELESIRRMCHSLGLDDVVFFKGSVPNDEIRKQMCLHDIFLFTSDRREGWGVVLNEAMGSGCAVVASDEVGSAPFLIKDGVNGLLFKSGNIEDFYEKVTWLMNSPEKCFKMGSLGKDTINNFWSPQKASVNLIQLICDIDKGIETSISEGPCSIATKSDI